MDRAGGGPTALSRLARAPKGPCAERWEWTNARSRFREGHGRQQAAGHRSSKQAERGLLHLSQQGGRAPVASVAMIDAKRAPGTDGLSDGADAVLLLDQPRCSCIGGKAIDRLEPCVLAS